MAWLRFGDTLVNLSRVHGVELQPSITDEEGWGIGLQTDTRSYTASSGAKDECRLAFEALAGRIGELEIVLGIEDAPKGDALRDFFGVGKL